jgi:cobalt-precorrin 5A hydrolase
MGLDETVTGSTGPLVAGIGFRRSATALSIATLIRDALGRAGREAEDLRLIATALDRAGDPALREAAAVFGLEPVGIGPEALAACAPAVSTHSARIVALRGVGCLCEAAALAGAGPGGVLAVGRIANDSVTCALAFHRETREKPEG